MVKDILKNSKSQESKPFTGKNLPINNKPGIETEIQPYREDNDNNS